MLHVSGVFETFILSNVHKLFQVLAEQTLEPGPTLPAVVSSLSPPNISSLLDISLPESKLRFYEKLRSRGGIWLQRQLFEYPISGLPSDGGGPSPMLADGDTLPSFTEASSSSLSGLVSLNTGPTIEGSDTLPSFAEASDSNLACEYGHCRLCYSSWLNFYGKEIGRIKSGMHFLAQLHLAWLVKKWGKLKIVWQHRRKA